MSVFACDVLLGVLEGFFSVKPVFAGANRVTEKWSQMPTGSLIPCVTDFLPQGLSSVISLLCLTESGLSSLYDTCHIHYVVLTVALNLVGNRPLLLIIIPVTPLFILTALSLLSSTGFSSLLRLWLARGCVICLIFGCSCALSCQLNIRHIPTDSGTDFWSLLPCTSDKKRHEVKCSGKWFWMVNFASFVLLCVA